MRKAELSPMKPVRAHDHEDAIAAIHDWYTSPHRRRGELGRGRTSRSCTAVPAYSEPVLIDEHVIVALEALVPLAPLHQPHHLAAIRAIEAAAPEVPQVACFDTAFHRTQPRLAQQFALPRELTAKGIRRYGFHGLSYEYIVSVLPRDRARCAPRTSSSSPISATAPACARSTAAAASPRRWVSRRSTGCRWARGRRARSRRRSSTCCSSKEWMRRRSSSCFTNGPGLLGVSGMSSDMRTLLASDEPAAKEAVDLFVYRIGRELGSLAAALGGLDALVFTGGIGEHAAAIRARVCRDARWLGVALDEAANAAGGPRISATELAVVAWVDADR